jgi:hypothetical protein
VAGPDPEPRVEDFMNARTATRGAADSVSSLSPFGERVGVRGFGSIERP